MAPGQRRTFEVDPARGGRALSALVRDETALAWTAAKELVRRGRVTVNGAVVTDPGERVAAGRTIAIAAEGPPRERAGELPWSRVVHVDPHVVVVDKPSGVSTVPYEEGERGTLVDLVRVALNRHTGAGANAPLFVVHRIDKETSGLVVFARSWLGKRHLAGLFRSHEVERVYTALVNGRLASDRITYESLLVENRGDGLRGSARQAGVGGQRAITHVETIERLPRDATLLRCQLETGRTHQIRIHLAEAGHPLVGERVYTRNWNRVLVPASRMMLHAATLGFTHPAETDRVVRFDSDPPDDFQEILDELRLED